MNSHRHTAPASWLDYPVRRWAAVVAGATGLTAWNAALVGAMSPKRLAIGFSAWVLMLAFGVYTWRRMTRGRRAERNAVVYEHGVLRFGLGLGVTLAVLFTFREQWPPRVQSWHDVSDLAFRLTMAALLQVPFGLWAGYFWGRTMGKMFRVPRGR